MLIWGCESGPVDRLVGFAGLWDFKAMVFGASVLGRTGSIMVLGLVDGSAINLAAADDGFALGGAETVSGGGFVLWSTVIGSAV
jgi:hypothetical protein